MRWVTGVWHDRPAVVWWSTSGELTADPSTMLTPIERKLRDGVVWPPVLIDSPDRTSEYDVAAAIFSTFDMVDRWTFDWEHSPDVVESSNRDLVAQALRRRGRGR